MSKFIGRQQNIGIGREATRGTPVVPALWMAKTNYTVEDKVAKAIFDGNYGVIAGGDDAFVAQKHAEGDLEFEMQDQTFGYILYALFGGISSAAFESVLKHTFTLANSVQHQSLTLMMNDPIGAPAVNNKSVAYARAMINSLEINVELGELVKCIANFMAQPHSDFSRQTASFSAENKFAHHHLTFKVAANIAALDAASKISLQSLNLRVIKNVERENALGTVQPVDIVNKKIEIEGTIRLTYEDRTYRDYMLDGTKKAIRITLNNPDVTIGSTTPQFQLDLPIVHFEGWEPTSPNDDLAMQEITFRALYDVTNSILIGANTFLVNEKANYNA